MLEVQPPFTQLNLTSHAKDKPDHTIHNFKWKGNTEATVGRTHTSSSDHHGTTMETGFAEAISYMRARHTAELESINEKHEEKLAACRAEASHLRASRRRFKTALASLQRKFHDLLAVRERSMVRIVAPCSTGNTPAISARTVCVLLACAAAHCLFRAINHYYYC
jgi:hypothetical protein